MNSLCALCEREAATIRVYSAASFCEQSINKLKHIDIQIYKLQLPKKCIEVWYRFTLVHGTLSLLDLAI